VAAFLILTLAASHPHPEEDDDIMEAIQAESSGARRVALWELVSLLPAMGMIILAAVYLSREPEAIRTIYGWMTYEPIPGWGAQPLRGLATGLAGWFIGGAVAWGARIVFTLAFGKEALGMGDVHILAATGAVAGWPVSFLGFFLAAPLALLGLVVIAFRRQARALPYGPWLALGFFVVILFQDRILDPLRHLLIFTGI
jgi:prepilin signal peptidase PulO-like enzyme (type II secretory pathway)